MRRRPTSQLLVLAAFLPAGVTALPALAVRAASDQSTRPFPGGQYFVVGCGFSQMKNDDPIVLAGQAGRVAPPHVHRQPGRRREDDARLAGRRRVELRRHRRRVCVLGADAVRRRAGAAAARRRRLLRAPHEGARPRVPAGARDDRRQPERETCRSRSPSSAGAAAASARRRSPRSCRTARPTGRCTSARRSRAAGTAAISTAPTTSGTWPTRSVRTLPAHAPGRGAHARPDLPLPRDRAAPAAAGVRPLRGACRLHERLEPGDARGVGGGAQLRRYNARPRGYSSAGRAPGSHPGGRRFEPA